MLHIIILIYVFLHDQFIYVASSLYILNRSCMPKEWTVLPITHPSIHLELSQHRFDSSCILDLKNQVRFRPDVALKPGRLTAPLQTSEGGGGRSSGGSSTASAASLTSGTPRGSPASTAARWYLLYLNQLGSNIVKMLHPAPLFKSTFSLWHSLSLELYS